MVFDYNISVTEILNGSGMQDELVEERLVCSPADTVFKWFFNSVKPVS